MHPVNPVRYLAALTRLIGEYRDLPGLRLTTPQAARLCGLSTSEADAVLAQLVRSGDLRRDRSGQYRLVSDDPGLTAAGSAPTSTASK